MTTGDQYFNTVANELRVWNGSTWQTASTVGGTVTSINVTGLATLATGAILNTPASATLTNATGLPLTTGVTGTLPTANGGTNLTSFTSGGVVYASSTSALATGSGLVFNGTNLGIGVTPSAWGGIVAGALQTGGGATLYSYGTDNFNLGQNVFYNGSGGFSDKYINNGFATKYYQASGAHSWYTAASGTAGNPISFTQAMTLTAAGNLLVGSSSSYAGKFQSWGAVTANAGTPNLAAIDTTSMASGVGGELAFIGQYTAGDYAYMGSIRGIKENGTDNNTACALTFYTRPSATAPSERMRIDSAGNVGIGAAPSSEWSSSALLQITSSSIYSTFSLASTRTVADGNRIGSIVWDMPNNTATYRTRAEIRCDMKGSTANKFGGLVAIDVAKDNEASPSSSAKFNAFGMGLGASIPSSGMGITFPATQSASSNANTLDDYEEGTWTASFVPNTSGSITMNAATGTYTKVGRNVTINGLFSVTSVSSPTGYLKIAGLPFSGGGTGQFRCAISIDGTNMNATMTTVLTATIQGDSNIYVLKPDGLGGQSLTTAADIKAGTQIFVGGTYLID